MHHSAALSAAAAADACCGMMLNDLRAARIYAQQLIN